MFLCSSHIQMTTPPSSRDGFDWLKGNSISLAVSDMGMGMWG